jgi:GTP cyclohydrolase II
MSVQLNNAKMFSSESIIEGKLRIEISALVNGLEKIKGAEKVCVRIHSECLTGDVFYSQKCDCGQEKLDFLQIMAHEEESSKPSVLVYIKGHEGRGVGLCNKIKAYKYVDDNPTATHVDALRAIGCEPDIRRYDSAVRFIKHRLQVKSIRLFTNNPHKMEAVRKYFGSQFSCEAMPAVSTVHNKKYLKERIQLLGHHGLL